MSTYADEAKENVRNKMKNLEAELDSVLQEKQRHLSELQTHIENLRPETGNPLILCHQCGSRFISMINDARHIYLHGDISRLETKERNLNSQIQLLAILLL